MTRYRTKVLEVDALQVPKGPLTPEDIVACGEWFEQWGFLDWEFTRKGGINVWSCVTDCWHEGEPGWYIVRNEARAEFYPVDPVTFEAKYERV